VILGFFALTTKARDKLKKQLEQLQDAFTAASQTIKSRQGSAWYRLANSVSALFSALSV
jgi:hypothetical protein